MHESLFFFFKYLRSKINFSYKKKCWSFGWLGFYGISTFAAYLMPNLVLCK